MRVWFCFRFGIGVGRERRSASESVESKGYESRGREWFGSGFRFWVSELGGCEEGLGLILGFDFYLNSIVLVVI